MCKLPIRWASIYNIDEAVTAALDKIEVKYPPLPSMFLAYEREVNQVARHMMLALSEILTKSHSIPTSLDCPDALSGYPALLFVEDLNDRKKTPYDPKTSAICESILYRKKFRFIQDIVKTYTLFEMQDTPVTLLHFGDNLIVIYHRPDLPETEI